jgi:hypothetical protein
VQPEPRIIADASNGGEVSNWDFTMGEEIYPEPTTNRNFPQFPTKDQELMILIVRFRENPTPE